MKPNKNNYEHMDIAIVNNLGRRSGMGRYAYELKEKLGIDILSTRNLPFPFFRRTLNDCFPKISANKNYDLYHICNELLGRLASSLKPSVVTITDLILYKSVSSAPFFARKLIKRSIESCLKAEKIIAISEYVRQDIISTFDVDGEQVVTTLLGVDNGTFVPHPKEVARDLIPDFRDRKIILHVGSEERRKNVETVLEVAKGLKKYNPLVLRIGSRTDRIVKAANEMGVELAYIQGVNDSMLSVYYSLADVFVFPSIEEGFGLPPLEAMASGCPVISSNTTSLPEVIGSGGLVFGPFDSQSMVEVTEKIFTDESFSRKLVGVGIKQAKNFSWESTAAQTKKVYERVL